MPHQAAAPVEADALRPLAQAIAHAPLPAVLKLLLLTLLASFSPASIAGRALRRPLRDWYHAPNPEAAAEDSHSVWHLRAIRRHRAWIGWILRCYPNEGMTLSGARALTPCPIRAARAPPSDGRKASPTLNPSPEPRLPAAMTHAQIPAEAPGTCSRQEPLRSQGVPAP